MLSGLLRAINRHLQSETEEFALAACLILSAYVTEIITSSFRAAEMFVRHLLALLVFIRDLAVVPWY